MSSQSQRREDPRPEQAYAYPRPQGSSSPDRGRRHGHDDDTRGRPSTNRVRSLDPLVAVALALLSVLLGFGAIVISTYLSPPDQTLIIYSAREVSPGSRFQVRFVGGNPLEGTVNENGEAAVRVPAEVRTEQVTVCRLVEKRDESARCETKGGDGQPLFEFRLATDG